MHTPKPRRSDATKAAILAAARRRFGAEGYDRATIRAIAADAGIDPSMVMRYFGSKEELFATAVDVPYRLPELESVPPAEIGEAVVRRMFALWEGDPAVLARLRRAVNDPEAAERMRGVIQDEFAAVVRAFVADEAEVRRRAGLVATQILGISLCRYILEVPDVAAMDVEELAASYGPTIQRYLAEPLP
ncbi:TetR family transcriptional regulator [Glycomyces endophyticus]|uniref:TetR family transcriptional regulator n=1 Tax=Glycomyces endophyticus TaxID=480996 RepID=A0ABP4T0S4_9ACTN